MHDCKLHWPVGRLIQVDTNGDGVREYYFHQWVVVKNTTHAIVECCEDGVIRCVPYTDIHFIDAGCLEVGTKHLPSE